jgi:hypothetical protein
MCVVSKGRAYWVDAADAARTFTAVHELVTQAMCHESLGVVLLADPWRVYACGSEGLRWTSERLGIEGLRLVTVDSDTILVAIETPDGEEEMVRIDIISGRAIPASGVSA